MILSKKSILMTPVMSCILCDRGGSEQVAGRKISFGRGGGWEWKNKYVGAMWEGVGRVWKGQTTVQLLRPQGKGSLLP